MYECMKFPRKLGNRWASHPYFVDDEAGLLTLSSCSVPEVRDKPACFHHSRSFHSSAKLRVFMRTWAGPRSLTTHLGLIRRNDHFHHYLLFPVLSQLFAYNQYLLLTHQQWPRLCTWFPWPRLGADRLASCSGKTQAALRVNPAAQHGRQGSAEAGLPDLYTLHRLALPEDGDGVTSGAMPGEVQKLGSEGHSDADARTGRSPCLDCQWEMNLVMCAGERWPCLSPVCLLLVQAERAGHRFRLTLYTGGSVDSSAGAGVCCQRASKTPAGWAGSPFS